MRRPLPTLPPKQRCRSRSTTGRRPPRGIAPSLRPAKGRNQLSERAKHAEEERDLAEAKYHHFELASGSIPDRNRAGFGDHHHRHRRAVLGFGLVGARGYRIHGSRHLHAASAASAVRAVQALHPSRRAPDGALLRMRPPLNPHGEERGSAARLEPSGMDEEQKPYRAARTLLRKRWITRSIRDDQPSPSPRTISMIRILTGSTSALALARNATTNP